MDSSDEEFEAKMLFPLSKLAGISPLHASEQVCITDYPILLDSSLTLIFWEIHIGEDIRMVICVNYAAVCP